MGIEWGQRKKKKSKRSRSRSAEKGEVKGGPTNESLAEVTRLPLMPRWKSPEKDQKVGEEREGRKRRHSPDPRGNLGESRSAKERKRSRSQENTSIEGKIGEKSTVSERKRSISK